LAAQIVRRLPAEFDVEVIGDVARRKPIGIANRAWDEPGEIAPMAAIDRALDRGADAHDGRFECLGAEGWGAGRKQGERGEEAVKQSFHRGIGLDIDINIAIGVFTSHTDAGLAFEAEEEANFDPQAAFALEEEVVAAFAAEEAHFAADFGDAAHFADDTSIAVMAWARAVEIFARVALSRLRAGPLESKLIWLLARRASIWLSKVLSAAPASAGQLLPVL